MRYLGTLIVLSLSLFFWKGVADQIAIHSWGVETEALIIAVHKDSSGPQSSFSGLYEFTTADKTLGHGWLPSNENASGKILKIRYLPNNPEINGPVSWLLTSFWLLFYGVPGGLLTVWATRILLTITPPRNKSLDSPAESSHLIQPPPPLRNTWILAVLVAAAVGTSLTLGWLHLLKSGALASVEVTPAGTAEDKTILVAESPEQARAAEASFPRAGVPGNDLNNGIFGFDQEWLYFHLWRNYKPNAPQPGLYRCRRADGTDFSLIGLPGQTENISQGTFLYDHWIYYQTREGISRIRVDGTNHQQLLESKVKSMAVANGYVFYQIRKSTGAIGRITLDGKKNVILSREKVGAWAVSADGHIYFANETDDGAIYRMRHDGSARRKISEQKARKMLVEGGLIWFLEKSSGHLMNMNTIGQNKQTVIAQKIWQFNLAEDRVFFVDEGAIKRCRYDGSEMEPVAEIAPALEAVGASDVCAFSGRLYFRPGGGNTATVKSVALDGSSPQVFTF
jgi:hypothetical protein